MAGRIENRIDTFHFGGNGAFSFAIDNAALTDQSINTGKSERRVRFTDTSTPMVVDSNVFIDNTTNYDGLKRVAAKAASSFDIVAPFTAETTSSATANVWLQQNDDWKFVGFEIHLNSASATSENLTVTIDSGLGAAWDVLVYSQDMNTVQDLLYYPEKEIPMAAADILKFAWTNTNGELFGLKVKSRQVN